LNRNSLKKYEAVGFVEALLAIAVAGIASVVLMTVAANTVAQVIRNETSNKMTEVAIEGASMTKKIAESHNNGDENTFPPIDGNINNCFAFEGGTALPEFEKQGDVFENVCNYDSGGRDQCKASVYPGDDELFRVFCITSESDSARGLVVGKIVVGLRQCDEVIANSKCELSDYEYYTAVKVIQSE
jgi:hypothetical protein